MAIQTNKLRRQNGMIAGVAGGLGAFFGLDPWIFRLIFLALIPLPPAALLPYIVLWLIIPRAR
ncbi:MAG: PspC domain-containing protein [Anaerolineales bacterium]|nr:PspC domain-containing protein [Anaerolineales bacterium]MCB9127252.1 PspC domain-containing protein [Ardenticatenales bacterium]MCB9172939.1 PspC domain-containing protein [Ardenticatenales bacterium]